MAFSRKVLRISFLGEDTFASSWLIGANVAAKVFSWATLLRFSVVPVIGKLIWRLLSGLG